MNCLFEIKSGSSFGRNLVNDMLMLGLSSVLHIILIKAHHDQNRGISAVIEFSPIKLIYIYGSKLMVYLGIYMYNHFLASLNFEIDICYCK